MRRVGSRELKNRLGGYLRMVKQGEILLITERNHPVARMVSVQPGSDGTPSVQELLERLEQSGSVRLAKKPLRRFRPVRVKGKPASKIILEDRR